jgi:hypothetical protein
MPQISQTRPLRGRVGCEMLGGASHSTLTPITLRSQLFVARYRLSPWLAQDLARLCFGEAGDE